MQRKVLFRLAESGYKMANVTRIFVTGVEGYLGSCSLRSWFGKDMKSSAWILDSTKRECFIVTADDAVDARQGSAPDRWET